MRSRPMSITVSACLLAPGLALTPPGVSFASTPARPADARDRLLGMSALVACGLLVMSTDANVLMGAVVVALLIWAAYRGFSRPPRPS